MTKIIFEGSLVGSKECCKFQHNIKRCFENLHSLSTSFIQWGDDNSAANSRLLPGLRFLKGKVSENKVLE